MFMRLTKRYIEKKLCNDLILWVDPSKIEYGVGTKWPNTKELQRRVTRGCASIPFGGRVASFIIKIIRRYDSFLISPS
jgi:hypothetical protein